MHKFYIFILVLAGIFILGTISYSTNGLNLCAPPPEKAGKFHLCSVPVEPKPEPKKEEVKPFIRTRPPVGQDKINNIEWRDTPYPPGSGKTWYDESEKLWWRQIPTPIIYPQNMQVTEFDRWGNVVGGNCNNGQCSPGRR